MLEASPKPRGAGGVLAPPYDFILVAREIASAGGALSRHLPFTRILGTKAQHRRDNPRDHIARFLDDDGVPFADILAFDIFRVVQRRH